MYTGLYAALSQGIILWWGGKFFSHSLCFLAPEGSISPNLTPPLANKVFLNMFLVD